MNWRHKAFIQKFISVFPNHEKLNYIFQKRVTKAVFLDDQHFGWKVEHARDHIAYFNENGSPNAESKVVELGTGWYPIIPMLFFLTKTGKVMSYDIQNWMTKDNQLATIKKLKEWKDNGKLESYISDIDEANWKVLLDVLSNPEQYSFEDINQVIGLSIHLKDASQSGLKEDSIDFICSNNTFEHIYPGVLKSILSEFKRIIKPEGVMSHFIDMSDHFAHSDPSITIYNFLGFSKKQWDFIDNKIQPQNRLRFKDFISIYNDLGIPVTETETREGDLDALKRTKVHPEFAGYSAEELAISHCYIVSKI
ncbi:MAG: class I SAM-dependent methyltransferase [Schleiferiaceae bacterium]|jgi:hypothetical protein|nr:class I SAM-dependent methyltransferase [Schleiferiaceae bacterium]